jgi:hypothetical protein
VLIAGPGKPGKQIINTMQLKKQQSPFDAKGLQSQAIDVKTIPRMLRAIVTYI